MRCQDLQQVLPSYAEGRVPPGERETIEAHLRGCPACRAALAEVDRLAAVLVQSQAPPVPPGLTRHVMAHARHRMARARTMWSPLAWWRAAPASMRGAAAAVLVMGFLGGWVMGRDIVHTRDSRPAVLTSSPNPLDGYNVDYLDDAPQDSLAGSYLALVSPRDKEGS